MDTELPEGRREVIADGALTEERRFGDHRHAFTGVNSTDDVEFASGEPP